MKNYLEPHSGVRKLSPRQCAPRLMGGRHVQVIVLACDSTPQALDHRPQARHRDLHAVTVETDELVMNHSGV